MRKPALRIPQARLPRGEPAQVLGTTDERANRDDDELPRDLAGAAGIAIGIARATRLYDGPARGTALAIS
jgi:hypothetical protein